MFRKRTEIELNSLPPLHPSIATTYINIGSIYNQNGHYDKALEYFEKGLEIQLKSLSPYHPSLATTYGNIGLIHIQK